MYKSIILICLFTSSAFSIGDQRGEYTIPTAAYSVCTGDLDLDGDNDIVTLHNYNYWTNWGGISYLINDGFGTFFLADSSSFITSFGPVKIHQLNQNLYPEIIFPTYNSSSDNIEIILDNSYSDTILLNTNTYVGIECVTTGNLNNTTYDDIIFASNQGHFWGYFYNYGLNHFSTPHIFISSAAYLNDVDCGDLDNDGKDEVVVCGQNTEIYLNDFPQFQCLTLEQGRYRSDVSIVDFDGDGDNDIIVEAGELLLNSTSLLMFKNNGNNQFDTLQEFWFQPRAYHFFITDFNNDSLPDILFRLDNKTGYKLYYNLGNFQLSDPDTITVPSYGEGYRNCFCADMDNNGYIDIITVRTYYAPLSGNLDIRFNDGDGNFGSDPIVLITYEANFIKYTFNNYPNPFQHETTFEYSIQHTSSVEISIHDFRGRLISQLINQTQNGGIHSIKWRGLDMTGKPCKSGTMIATLKVDRKNHQSIKVIKY